MQPPKTMSPARDNHAQKHLLRDYVTTIEQFYDLQGIKLQIVEINPEPLEIQFCAKIALGTPIKNVIKYQRALATILATPLHQITIDAPIPGRDVIGFTIPRISPEPIPPIEKLDNSIRKNQAQIDYFMSKCAYYVQLAEKIAGPANNIIHKD